MNTRQQVIRRLTQTGQDIHVIHDDQGNRIAEYLYDATLGTSTLIREYLWIGLQPIAVVEGGVTYYGRSDHIGRPVFATDGTGTTVWDASYLPFGGLHSSTGPNSDLRFPGQWFQSESGLHQNWMRDYDPTTGRYIQADPLGLVDGASVYGYVTQNPNSYVDPRGEFSTEPWRRDRISPTVFDPMRRSGGGGGGVSAVTAAAIAARQANQSSTSEPPSKGDSNIIPFPNSSSSSDEPEQCTGDDGCMKRYETLLRTFEVLVVLIKEGGSLAPSAIRGYIANAKAYNAECGPKGYPLLPTSFISGANQ